MDASLGGFQRWQFWEPISLVEVLKAGDAKGPKTSKLGDKLEVGISLPILLWVGLFLRICLSHSYPLGHEHFLFIGLLSFICLIHMNHSAILFFFHRELLCV